MRKIAVDGHDGVISMVGQAHQTFTTGCGVPSFVNTGYQMNMWVGDAEFANSLTSTVGAVVVDDIHISSWYCSKHAPKELVYIVALVVGRRHDGNAHLKTLERE